MGCLQNAILPKRDIQNTNHVKKNNRSFLEAYTDADNARVVVDRKSTTCSCTFLKDNLVT